MLDQKPGKTIIDLEQARGGLVRLIQPSGKGMADRSHACRTSVIWLLPESLLRPRRGLVIAAGEEMTGARPMIGSRR